MTSEASPDWSTDWTSDGTFSRTFDRQQTRQYPSRSRRSRYRNERKRKTPTDGSFVFSTGWESEESASPAIPKTTLSARVDGRGERTAGDPENNCLPARVDGGGLGEGN